MPEEVVAAEGVAEGTPVEPVVETGVADAGLTEGTHSEAAESGSEQPELYTVRVGGREEKVTLDQALEGHMRQADYTRKTQELAAERNELTQMRALQTALERNPQATLAALASALGVPLAAGQPAAADDSEADPLEILAKRIESLSDTFTQRDAAQTAAQQQAQQAAIVQGQIERELTDLESIYGQFDRKALLQFAVDKGTPNLDVAYAAWQFDVNEQQRIAETNKATEAKRRARVVEGGSSPAAGATVTGSPGEKRSVRDAFLMAVAAQK